MVRKYLKRFVYFCVAVTFVIAGAWVAGTFNPNDYTVQKIEDEFHKKEMRIIEELGLKVQSLNSQIKFHSSMPRATVWRI